jgi:hypothetical protein
MGTLHEDVFSIYDDITEFFLQWEMFQTQVVEKIRTCFMLNNSFSENLGVHETMSKNVMEPKTPQMILQ